MPRAFTEVERKTIRTKLLETGRACFLRYGLKKTTIEDLTGPAGIAKASFYLFFDNKEALFVELFMEEMPAMMNRLLDASFRSTSNAREALIRLMQAIVREIEANEISRIILDDPSEMERLAAGLDYPGVGPEHAWLKDIGRVNYEAINDDEAVAAFHRLTRTEGIMPALESSHAVAQAIKLAPTMKPDQAILVSLSGRGDKDIHTVAELEGIKV